MRLSRCGPSKQTGTTRPVWRRSYGSVGFKQVRIKSRDSSEVRALLTGRETLVRIRVQIENEIRGVLRTFGIVFKKAAGGFTRRADEMVAGELDASTSMRGVVEALVMPRAATIERIKDLDRQVLVAARASAKVVEHDPSPGVRRSDHPAVGSRA
jgi:transposase